MQKKQQRKTTKRATSLVLRLVADQRKPKLCLEEVICGERERERDNLPNKTAHIHDPSICLLFHQLPAKLSSSPLLIATLIINTAGSNVYN